MGTSAKEDTNVKEAFEGLIKQVYDFFENLKFLDFSNTNFWFFKKCLKTSHTRLHKEREQSMAAGDEQIELTTEASQGAAGCAC